MNRAELVEIYRKLEDEANRMDREAVRSTCGHCGRQTRESFVVKQHINELRGAASRVKRVALEREE